MTSHDLGRAHIKIAVAVIALIAWLSGAGCEDATNPSAPLQRSPAATGSPSPSFTEPPATGDSTPGLGPTGLASP